MENIDTLEFGAEIAVHGMPAWLADDEQVMGKWRDWFDCPTNKSHYANPTSITAIRLPADHWTYPVIAAGFEPWGGGDDAPEDWDGGACMMRSTHLLECAFHNQPRWTHLNSASDIIGYKRKVAPGSEVWDRALMNTPTPADTVTIPTMTKGEARGKAVAYSDRWLADELKTVQDVIMAVYTDLGLIRPAILLDQFEAHHGGLDDNQRAIIEIYQEWIAAQ